MKLFHTVKPEKLLPVLLGNLLIACAIKAFIIPGGFISGGSTGLAVVLNRFAHLPFDLAVTLISPSCFLLGWLFLKSGFAARTLVSAMVYPVFVRMTAFLTEIRLTEDLLLCAILAGVLMGCGLGMILQADASSGGLDIPPIILEKKCHIPVSVSMWSMDVLLLGMQVMQASLSDIVFGLIYMAITYVTMNRILSSGKQAVEILIYSRLHEEVLSCLIHDLDKGASFIQIESGYARKEGLAVHSVFSRKDLPSVQNAVFAIDPSAFMVISNVREVRGTGFKPASVQKKAVEKSSAESRKIHTVPAVLWND